MSDTYYPTLPGLAWSVRRTPMFKTLVHTTASGREFRQALMTRPRWRWGLQYEFLRSAAAWAELQSLAGFYLQRLGAADSFLLVDPDDTTVADQPFGVGDGTTNSWQLTRTFGGFTEPIDWVIGAPVIKVNGTAIGRAEVVVAGENYGLKVIDLDGLNLDMMAP